MPHPFRVFDKLDAPIWKGVVELMVCGTVLGCSVAKFIPLAFPSFSAIYFPYIVTGVIVSAIVGIVPQVWRPISYEAEKTFALTQLQVEDETKKVFKQVPLVVHQHKEEWGWRIVYHLPKGLSYRQVMGKKEYLETALRAEVDMQWDGKYLHMDIATKEVPEHIEYFIDTDRAESPGVIVEGLDTDAPPIDSRGDGERKEQLPPPDNCDFGEV